MAPGVWRGEGDTRKTGLTEGLARAMYVQVWEIIRGPPFTMKERIVEMQFPAVLKGLLQSLLKRYSVTFSIPPPQQPTLFPISMQLCANCKTHIFKKWGTYQKTPVVRFKSERGPVSDIPRVSIWLSTGLVFTRLLSETSVSWNCVSSTPGQVCLRTSSTTQLTSGKCDSERVWSVKAKERHFEHLLH